MQHNIAVSNPYINSQALPIKLGGYLNWVTVPLIIILPFILGAHLTSTELVIGKHHYPLWVWIAFLVVVIIFGIFSFKFLTKEANQVRKVELEQMRNEWIELSELVGASEFIKKPVQVGDLIHAQENACLYKDENGNTFQLKLAIEKPTEYDFKNKEWECNISVTPVEN